MTTESYEMKRKVLSQGRRIEQLEKQIRAMKKEEKECAEGMKIVNLLKSKSTTHEQRITKLWNALDEMRDIKTKMNDIAGLQRDIYDGLQAIKGKVSLERYNATSKINRLESQYHLHLDNLHKQKRRLFPRSLPF